MNRWFWWRGDARTPTWELRHPEYDHRHARDAGDPLEDAVGRAEEEGAVQAEEGDALVPRLGGQGEFFALHSPCHGLPRGSPDDGYDSPTSTAESTAAVGVIG